MQKACAILTALLLSSPAFASNWIIQKNEQDPFDKSKATFIAYTQESGHELVIRCLAGDLSFALFMPAGSVERAAEMEMKIVSEDKEPISTEGMVLSSDVLSSIVQFGGQNEMDYLEGAKKFWVRASGGVSTTTYAFTGGRSFNDAIAKAEKACGVLAPAAQPSPTATILPKMSARSANKDCSKEVSCASQFTCLSERHELGDAPDADGFFDWCRYQAGMKP